VIMTYLEIRGQGYPPGVEWHGAANMTNSLPKLSILGFVEPSRFQEISSEVNYFLAALLLGGRKFETVVAVDRKGKRIMRSFFQKNPRFLKGTVLISDNDCERKHVLHKRVLVFDDSIHTGKTIIGRFREIMRHRPSELSIGCLLINGYSRKMILAEFPMASMYSCKPPFKTYALQRKTYLEWEMTYLDGMEVKDNPDCVEFVMRSSCTDVKKVYDAVVSSAIESMDVVKSHEIKSSTRVPNHRSVTFILRKDPRIFPEHLRPICEHDLPKIRCFVTAWEKETEISFMPLINPRFRARDCNISSTNPRMCLRRISRTHDAEFCKLCVTYSVHSHFIHTIEKGMISGLRKKGVPVRHSIVKPPSFRRFLV